ncbi:MAG: GNAT superfamily N-acetyltransferase [Verrucomicrobiales bacterium]|jgi:GNAT superfamily N-acetyltransferase
MSAELTIRPAKVEDAEPLFRLAVESKAFWDYDEAQMAIFRKELNFSGEQLVDLSGHVAELKGKLVGYFTLVVHSNELVELEHLFVDPALLRQGIGQQLLMHAIEFSRARGHRLMKIISDPHAAGFYEKAGAEKVDDHESSIPGRTIPVLEIRL